jgi:anthocyanidin reductase
VLTEKAACAFAQDTGISLVTVCPVVVVGAAPATRANTSVSDVLSLLSGEPSLLQLIQNATSKQFETFIDLSSHDPHLA